MYPFLFRMFLKQWKTNLAAVSEVVNFQKFHRLQQTFIASDSSQMFAPPPPPTPTMVENFLVGIDSEWFEANCKSIISKSKFFPCNFFFRGT